MTDGRLEISFGRAVEREPWLISTRAGSPEHAQFAPAFVSRQSRRDSRVAAFGVGAQYGGGLRLSVADEQRSP